jgi:hypothetical protein
VTIVDTLNEIWNKILEITSMFVIPDWGALIGLLPIFIFLGVVGPLITFFILGVMGYQIAKPRTKVEFVEGPRVAPRDDGGDPVFAPGLPYCRRDALIYQPGTLNCDRCDDELAVVCPMCGLGRMAAIDTCTNCGLVLKVKAKPVPVSTTSGPKPGGAAVA